MENKIKRNIKRISQEKSELFTLLYNHYEKEIKADCNAQILKTSRWLFFRRKDILAETRLEVWQHMDSYDKTKSFTSWFSFWLNIVIKRVRFNKPRYWQEIQIDDFEKEIDKIKTTQGVLEEVLESECRKQKRSALIRIFKTICEHGSPPHQVLVYLYSKTLIEGWKPTKIRAELSGETLNRLYSRYCQLQNNTGVLLESEWEESLCTLRKDLQKPVKDVQRRGAALEKLKHIWHQPSGSTLLQDYYRQKPTQSITTWIRRVHERVINNFSTQPDEPYN